MIPADAGRCLARNAAAARRGKGGKLMDQFLNLNVMDKPVLFTF